jgi:hypothetical protein
MKVITHNDFPLSLRHLLPQIRSMLAFLPSWVQTVHLRYERSEGDMASVEVQYEYRTITLNIHPLIIEDDDDWKSTILHELGHCILAPYTQLAARIVTKAVNEVSREFILAELETAEEAVTEDLKVFLEKIKERNGDV